MEKRYIIGLIALFCFVFNCAAEDFVELTSDEVSIDSVLPYYTKIFPLGYNYNDSTYNLSIEYPEFVPMTEDEIIRYKSITSDSLPELPKISQAISISRKQGQLDVSFVPLVFRDGKYQKLVSFKLNLSVSPKVNDTFMAKSLASTTTKRYADHSVLASGNWAKIRVSASGVYQLTDALIKKAGFSDASKVKIYGYGGALFSETLTADVLTKYDDLKEIPTYTVGGKRLFYAQGPISWKSTNATTRTFNPYSSYGYYFLTESDSVPLSVDSTTFASSFYPSGDDYHTLYEVDDYSWFAGGRNLFDSRTITAGSSRSYTLTSPGLNQSGYVTIAVTANKTSVATVTFNDSTIATMSISAPGEYDAANEVVTKNLYIKDLKASNVVTIKTSSGGPVRLDYISLYYNNPRPLSPFTTTTYNAPEYVGRIENQDLHADSSYDMVIIVPTSSQLTSQAERIKEIHETKDSMRVKIVAADQLYNEFSSGTPDATAYRRYMKMLYDRATTNANMPRYLLLFGDCAWDNRMLTSDWKGYDPDDYLLCFESENSFSETDCFIMEDYFGLLDDGEGGYLTTNDKPDIGVGRISARTEDQAKIMVDKTISYINNENAGEWLNTICFMGDDGNDNLHMNDANIVANMVENSHPGYNVKRVMWDAFTRYTSSTGNTYPDVTRILKQTMSNGALMMNYTGHGATYCISHEKVLQIADFEEQYYSRFPLWVTASCDIMPFDGQVDNIGEEAMLNKKGGAVAFFGTTRTVYSLYNRKMNLLFTDYVLGSTNGVRNRLGDAVRMAKTALVNTGQDWTANKLQFSLLGDPALTLACPTYKTVIDSINGKNANTSTQDTLKAGTTARIVGHVELNGTKAKSFNGTMTATVRDSKETIVCKNNADANTAFTYQDRTKTLFNGSDSVNNGTFKISFPVPMDINYSNKTGMINVYAISKDLASKANGEYDNFIVGGSTTEGNDSIGPSIYCYLNSPTFQDGSDVNTTPYFVAQIVDKDGINATGNGIGHDLELIIDGDMSMTYVLNDYYTNDFGSYTSGSVSYNIPELAEGKHNLLFRAWDVLNNSSKSQLSFNVVKALTPNCINVSCTNNPAKTSTTFIINHDRAGSELNVEIDLFDLSGRQLWQYNETGTSMTNNYTVNWDLTTSNGERLSTGVYLYRARISCDGSNMSSKAKKLIVIGNK